MVKAADFLTEEANTGTVFQYKVAADGEERRYCKCGCNQQVVGKKLYRPGHDARHVAQLAAEVVAFTTPAKQNKALRTGLTVLEGSPKLQIKLVVRVQTLLGGDFTELIESLSAPEEEVGEE